MTMTITAIFLLASIQSGCSLLHPSGPRAKVSSPPISPPAADDRSQLARREALSLAFGAVVVGVSSAAALLPSSPANAFENRISKKYDDQPKRRGPMPKDLGIADRTSTSLDGDISDYTGLKGCGAAPNCFSSSLPVSDDPDHSIPAFVWPAGETQEQAFLNLKDVVLAYPPGQNGVDGGGFEIQSFDAKKGYLYVQFEALKRGYIDDVEFAVIPGSNNNEDERVVQVRSSSRVGYLDFGVNAKRLNCIAKALRTKGWDVAGVDLQTHQGYALENQL